MKKILITIIIILIILLIGQLIFFKVNNNNLENSVNKNTTSNDYSNNSNINDNSTVIENTNQDIIIPEGMDDLIKEYDGEIRLSMLEEEFYDFIYSDVKAIYNLTTRKSQNAILQLYDTNRSTINNMHIYSADDFLGLTSQIFMFGNIKDVSYSSSKIELSELNKDESGYTTFYVSFSYTNKYTLKMKVYVANNNSIEPSIKFGV